jgi:GT2 family glycosyltransferase
VTDEGRVGVVVLTYNRRHDVTRTLARLCALPSAPRLVVVDNGSTDGTAAALAAAFPGVEVLRLPRNVGAAGRNAGARRLDTPYVAFCDDDTWWAPGALAHAARLLDAHPRLALVTGTVLVEPGGRLDPTCLEMARSPLPGDAQLPGRPVLGFLCAATVVRRDVFLAVGGFEPRFFLGGEESLLAIDLAARGWQLAYVHGLVVHHQPSTRRHSRRRRRLLLRNALWCAWLRRPLGSALRVTATILGARYRDPVLVPAVVEALAGVPWVLSERRVIPDEVDRGLRLLDRRWHGGCAESPSWAPRHDFWRWPAPRSTRTRAGSRSGHS